MRGLYSLKINFHDPRKIISDDDTFVNDDYLYADTPDSLYQYIDFYNSDPTSSEYIAASTLNNIQNFLQTQNFFSTNLSSSLILGAIFDKNGLQAATHTLTQMVHGCKIVNETHCKAALYTAVKAKRRIHFLGKTIAERMDFNRIKSLANRPKFLPKNRDRATRLSEFRPKDTAQIGKYKLVSLRKTYYGKSHNIYNNVGKTTILASRRTINPIKEKATVCSPRPYRYYTKTPCTTTSDAVHVEATKCHVCTIQKHSAFSDTICGEYN